MADDQPATFTQRSAQRIAVATKWVERRLRSQPGKRKRWHGARGLFIKAGKLDAELTEGSSATMTIWTNSSGSWAATTKTITVYDWLLSTGQSIASGKKVVAVRIALWWVVIAAECA